MAKLWLDSDKSTGVSREEMEAILAHECRDYQPKRIWYHIANWSCAICYVVLIAVIIFIACVLYLA